MIRRLLAALGIGPRKSRIMEFPSVDRADVQHVFETVHGLPQVDWAMARLWIDRRAADQRDDEWYRRAIAAAWLDELRDSLATDHRRWRRPGVEGLGPLDGWQARETCEWADRTIEELRKTLTPIRGAGPIPPVALICFGKADDYNAFRSRGQRTISEEIAPALYFRESDDAFPVVVIHAHAMGQALIAAVVHELTHHALRESCLPLCIEEGYTQMMEERIAGLNNFQLDRERIERHRRHWDVVGLDSFLTGQEFYSGEHMGRELAYHLSQWLVRSQLQERPKEFFGYSRACCEVGAEAAAIEHLGETLESLARRTLGAT